MKMKLAEALLLRKTLANKLERMEFFKRDDLFEVKVERKLVGEGKFEEIKTSIPKLSLKDATEAYNDVAKKVRLLDSAIQFANWQHSIDLPKDFEAKKR